MLHEHLLNGDSHYRHFLRMSDGTRIPVEGVDKGRDLLTGDRVRARGARSGRAAAPAAAAEALHLQTQSAESLQVLQYAPLANTFGVQKVAVLLVNFENDPRQPYTIAQQRAWFDRIDAFYRENSYGQTSLAVDIFGWYTLPVSNTSCTTSSIRSYAMQAAAAAGVDLAPYARLVFHVPNTASCPFAGVSTIGGTPSSAWINANSPMTYTDIHELGHGFGLRHSHALDCEPGHVIDGPCTVNEYGDVTDMMGASTGHFNAFQKQRLGWLGYGASPPITAVESSGVYTIDAYELPGTGPKALKIARAQTLDAFWVEYRRNDQGVDQGIFRSGVFVHLANDTNPNSSQLLDMAPETPSWYADTALDVGKSFTDPLTGITISTVSASSTSATIMVSIGPSCTRTRPTVAASPRQSADVQPGTTVSYSVSVTNIDSQACPPSSFSLQAAVPTGWTKSLSAPTVTLSPGATATTTLLVTSPTVSPGSYPIVGTATNTMASTLSGSDSVIYSVSAGGGGSGGGGATFTDNFDRPDSAATLGNGWTTVVGTLGLKAGRASSALVRTLHGALQPTLQGATQTITGQFTSSNNNAGPRFGLFARYVNAGNHYVCYRQVGGSSALRIAKVINGAEKILKSVGVSNPSRGASFTVGCEVTGTMIKASLGAKTISATDGALPTGAAGFFMGYAGGSGGASEHTADSFQATVQ